MKLTISNGYVTQHNGYWLALEIPREQASKLNELDKLLKSDKLKVIDVDLHREIRSLNANAYSWVLIDKIAKKMRSTSEEIYIKLLHDYGTKDYIATTPEIAENIKKAVKIIEQQSEVSINGTMGYRYLLIRGSSTYDKKEFSEYLNGIIDDATALGIETMTPNQIKEMMASYKPV